MRNKRGLVFARAWIALITVALIGAPFALPASAQTCTSSRLDSWILIGAPRFSTGPQEIRDYAIDPVTGSTVFVTNGQVVMRSLRLGCEWEEVYVLPTAGGVGEPTAATSTIIRVEFAANNHNRIFLGIRESVAAGSRPHILTSGDTGRSWTPGIGLPPQGDIQQIFTPVVEGAAFVGLDVNGGTMDVLFASTDGGATWSLRSNLHETKTQAGVNGFTIDPFNPESLWAYGAGSIQPGTNAPDASGLMRSTDGGRSFQNVEEFAGTVVGPVDVYSQPNRHARIAAFQTDQGNVAVSNDGGQTWPIIDAPNGADSVAHGEDRDQSAVTALGELYTYHPQSFSWINLQAPLSGLVDAQSDRRLFRYYARNNAAIVVYTGPDVPDPGDLPDSVFDVPLINPPASLEKRPPAFTPARRTVLIDPGKSKTLTYRLAVPERPLPLNVFFLLDTSDSMGSTIEDLARSTANIINALVEENIDFKVGIGAFRAYPDRFPPDPPCGGPTPPSSGRCEKNYVFKKIFDIQSPIGTMSQALSELESDAGGKYKSHLGALYQIATGEGQDLYPPGPAGHDVPPGLDVQFEEKALKVVLHATDERFASSDGSPKPPGADFSNPVTPDIPTFDEVATAFRERDILQIGLSINRAPRGHLERVARDTGALAPAEGVDCDGDGVDEIPAGEPLVCALTRRNLEAESTNMVPAIVNMLQALPTGRDVTLEVDGNEEILGKVSPRTHKDVVLQVANELVFDVEYRCPIKAAGKEFDFKLAAEAENRGLLDNATTRVVCGGLEKVPVVPPLVLALLPPIPPPPPPPVSQLTSSTQAQGQAQAQAGAAFQEEEQPQVAVAAAYKEMLEQRAAMEYETYEMTAYRSRRDPPVSPLFVLGVGVMMGACAYGLTLARERIHLALQRDR